MSKWERFTLHVCTWPFETCMNNIDINCIISRMHIAEGVACFNMESVFGLKGSFTKFLF